MTRAKIIAITVFSGFWLAACGSDNADESVVEVQELDATESEVSAKNSDPQLGGALVTPGAPYKVSYRIVGTPLVGSPVTIDLTIQSLRGSRPVDLVYRVTDATALMLGDSQVASVHLEPAVNELEFRQQVTVVPQREGRFYLNVGASFETENGTQSTITAIPIQVGSGSRELTPNGEVQTDENGEAVRVLSNE